MVYRLHAAVDNSPTPHCPYTDKQLKKTNVTRRGTALQQIWVPHPSISRDPQTFIWSQLHYPRSPTSLVHAPCTCSISGPHCYEPCGSHYWSRSLSVHVRDNNQPFRLPSTVFHVSLEMCATRDCFVAKRWAVIQCIVSLLKPQNREGNGEIVIPKLPLLEMSNSVHGKFKRC